MPISGKMYVWGDGVKHVPEMSGVFALYNQARNLIYIGESTNLRRELSDYWETNFSDDPCKGETGYYKREVVSNPKGRLEELLNEYDQKHGESPKCNLSQEPQEKQVASEWGFYFYENIGKPLYEVSFNPQDLREKIRNVPVASLEFHQKRGDFAKWIRDVFKDTQLAEAIEKMGTTGEDLRRDLMNILNPLERAECPNCGLGTGMRKSWKMIGRPSKEGIRIQLTIGLYKCSGCGKTFRKVLSKKKMINP